MLFTKHSKSDQVEENEVEMTHMEKWKLHTTFWFQISEEEIPHTRTRSGRPTWEDNINLELKEIMCEYVDWIQLVEDKVRWRVLETAEMRDLRFSRCNYEDCCLVGYDVLWSGTSLPMFPENRDSAFHRNIGKNLSDSTALHHRRH